MLSMAFFYMNSLSFLLCFFSLIYSDNSPSIFFICLLCYSTTPIKYTYCYFSILFSFCNLPFSLSFFAMFF